MNRLRIVFVVLALAAYSVAAATPRLNKHAAKNVSCEACHGVANPTVAPKVEQCSTCHGDYKTLKEDTKNINPNPHDAFHLGNGDIRCSLCHKNHQESTLLCNQCHVESRTFDIRVP